MVAKKKVDKMIVDDNVQKLQMGKWEPLAESNARVAAYNKSTTQQGGNPHQRESVKNVGGSSVFPSHPLSEGSWKLIADDMRKNRR
mgnify:CR=1 FL=1